MEFGIVQGDPLSSCVRSTRCSPSLCANRRVFMRIVAYIHRPCKGQQSAPFAVCGLQGCSAFGWREDVFLQAATGLLTLLALDPPSRLCRPEASALRRRPAQPLCRATGQACIQGKVPDVGTINPEAARGAQETD